MSIDHFTSHVTGQTNPGSRAVNNGGLRAFDESAKQLELSHLQHDGEDQWKMWTDPQSGELIGEHQEECAQNAGSPAAKCTFRFLSVEFIISGDTLTHWLKHTQNALKSVQKVLQHFALPLSQPSGLLRLMSGPSQPGMYQSAQTKQKNTNLANCPSLNYITPIYYEAAIWQSRSLTCLITLLVK